MDELIRETFLRADEDVCSTDKKAAESKKVPRNKMIPGPGAVAVRLCLSSLASSARRPDLRHSSLEADMYVHQSDRGAQCGRPCDFEIYSSAQVVAVVICGMIHVAWVGDSRCVLEDGAASSHIIPMCTETSQEIQVCPFLGATEGSDLRQVGSASLSPSGLPAKSALIIATS